MKKLTRRTAMRTEIPAENIASRNQQSQCIQFGRPISFISSLKTKIKKDKLN
jgi:hypothetical protein